MACSQLINPTELVILDENIEDAKTFAQLINATYEETNIHPIKGLSVLRVTPLTNQEYVMLAGATPQETLIPMQGLDVEERLLYINLLKLAKICALYESGKMTIPASVANSINQYRGLPRAARIMATFYKMPCENGQYQAHIFMYALKQILDSDEPDEIKN